MGNKIKTEGEFQVLVEGERYRVCTISRLAHLGRDSDNNISLKVINMPISYGLAVEEKTADNHYFIVAIVKYDYDTQSAVLDPVGFRAIETLDGLERKLVEEYHNCVMFAKNTLEDIAEKDIFEDSEAVDLEEKRTGLA